MSLIAKWIEHKDGTTSSMDESIISELEEPPQAQQQPQQVPLNDKDDNERKRLHSVSTSQSPKYQPQERIETTMGSDHSPLKPSLRHDPQYSTTTSTTTTTCDASLSPNPSSSSIRQGKSPTLISTALSPTPNNSIDETPPKLRSTHVTFSGSTKKDAPLDTTSHTVTSHSTASTGGMATPLTPTTTTQHKPIGRKARRRQVRKCGMSGALW
eukprot:CAMPEP_0176153552 /NCGR_PEP_ID=MMETSP0120_2-20121206/78441_1 /TAXON_ID=160619 /ORGANISM="Kryptoperidinium foliaceum, Strain CCMP 1326" /LENGTH=211 /DNA_ID=CAMNT_0017490615 /DNA_START=247 /DNA_END=879 /DNA_ORIENTATION=+